nr:uncharacterized protein LOC102454881 [Pelodiscus sinensis]|eukprot:XP_006120805.1 uncharacterized protein LOC102454881 [Pelodiscus sinensis]
MKNTYFHISIIPAHWRFLRFIANGLHYRFKVFLFGLSTMLQVFTKCMAVVATFLRKHQVLVFPYLNHCLMKGGTQEQALHHMGLAQVTYSTLDLILRVPKFQLVLAQGIEFIGAFLDSTRVRAFLPEPCFHGRYSYPAVVPCHCGQKLHEASGAHGNLHIRHAACHTPLLPPPDLVCHGSQAQQRATRSMFLRVDLQTSLKNAALDGLVILPQSVLRSLNWWLQPQEMCVGSPFTSPQSSLSLIMEASEASWGVHLGELILGLSSYVELSLYISVRELRGQFVLLVRPVYCHDDVLHKEGIAFSSPLCHEALHLWDF